MLTAVLLVGTLRVLNGAAFWLVLYKYQLNHSKDKKVTSENSIMLLL